MLKFCLVRFCSAAAGASFVRRKFVDKVGFDVRAGDGGFGSVSYTLIRGRRIATGGDGGQGGSVVLQVQSGVKDLGRLRKVKYSAENGERGRSNGMNGICGQDCVLRAPIGTTLYRRTQEGKLSFVKDLLTHGERIILAKGGAGGKGNKSTIVGREGKAGGKGEEARFLLILKLLADIGLVGLPNVGKSTLLACLTQAKPQIADYEFTTLYPNLGRMQFIDGSGITVSDLPGIIQDCSKNRGLGFEFLRHIQRNKVLLLVLDMAGQLPLGQQLDLLLKQLFAYKSQFKQKQKIVVANRMDLVADGQRQLAELRQQTDLPCVMISAKEKAGLSELVVLCRQAALV